MSEEVNYQANWADQATQCQSCLYFKSQDGKTACVPEDKTFAEALSAYGEGAPNGHCNFFTAK